MLPGGRIRGSLAAHAVSTVDSYVHGFVLQKVNLPFRHESQLAAMTAAIMDSDVLDGPVGWAKGARQRTSRQAARVLVAAAQDEGDATQLSVRDAHRVHLIDVRHSE